ncbi:thioredoxin H5-like [Quercus robur]|uniref:Thioredoxin domain-containing protein n=1 Tax=Quercus lobata TaxID=97700 RepID=A0A7N2LBZ5_QUELO|nr:thioredoxin H5-like [Quercus lobata]XP_050276965.1 thioredoxin H5-like [Quercus robur]
MGANFSMVESESGPSRVTAYHSKDQWKAYFETSKQCDKLVVIDFSATWCGPCQFIEPTFKELSCKYTNVDFVKIDVDELEAVAQEFAVEAMPTFIFIKKGKVVDKVVGARKDDLQTKIEKHST